MAKIKSELLSEHENPLTESKEMFMPNILGVSRSEHREWLQSQSFGRRYDAMRERDSNPFNDR